MKFSRKRVRIEKCSDTITGAFQPTQLQGEYFMGFVMLWVLTAATVILGTAYIFSCSGRFRRPFWQVIFPVLGLLLVFAGFMLAIALASFMALRGSDPDWRFYTWSLFVTTIGAASLLLAWGKKRRTGALVEDTSPSVIKAASWNRLNLGLCFLAVAAANLTVYARMDAQARLRLDRLKTEAGFLARSVAPIQIPDNRNAALLYARAAAETELSYDQKIEEIYNKLLCAEGQELINLLRKGDGLKELLANKNKVLSSLRKAAGLSDCYFQHNYASPSIGMELPEISEMRGSARLLKFSALAAAVSGNTARAISDLRGIIAISDNLKATPLGIIQMVSWAVDTMAFETLENILHCSTPTSEELAQLLPETPREFNISRNRALIMEEAFSLVGFALFARDSSDLRLLLSSLWHTDTPCQQKLAKFMGMSLVSYWRVFMLEGELAAYRKIITEEQQRCLSWRKYRRFIATSFSRHKYCKHGILADALITMLPVSTESMARAQARHSVMRVVLAAAIYKNDKGSYPDKIEDLKSFFPDGFPIDPYTGKSILLNPVKDGLIIYAAGFNRLDDKGAKFNLGNGQDDISFGLGAAYQRPEELNKPKRGRHEPRIKSRFHVRLIR